MFYVNLQGVFSSLGNAYGVLADGMLGKELFSLLKLGLLSLEVTKIHRETAIRHVYCIHAVPK